jgi:hypothetical protein
MVAVQVKKNRKSRGAYDEVEEMTDDRDQQRDASYCDERGEKTPRRWVMPAWMATMPAVLTPMAMPCVALRAPAAASLVVWILGSFSCLPGLLLDRKLVADAHTKPGHDAVLQSRHQQYIIIKSSIKS